MLFLIKLFFVSQVFKIVIDILFFCMLVLVIEVFLLQIYFWGVTKWNGIVSRFRVLLIVFVWFLGLVELCYRIVVGIFDLMNQRKRVRRELMRKVDRIKRKNSNFQWGQSKVFVECQLLKNEVENWYLYFYFSTIFRSIFCFFR